MMAISNGLSSKSTWINERETEEESWAKGKKKKGNHVLGKNLTCWL